MKYWPLLWAGLWRKRTRTILTLLAVATAFLLFGLLQGVNAAFTIAVDNSDVRRLITFSRLSIIDLQPYSHKAQIERLPGIEHVVEMIYFGGYYQDPKNAINSYALSPEIFSIVPEIRVSKEAIATLRRTRTGAIVGTALARKYGWKVGDRLPLNSSIHANSDGSHAWQFDIVGTMQSSTNTQIENTIYMNYDYVSEAGPLLKGKASYYYVGIRDPKDAVQIAAKIDALFANSNDETRTQTEKEYIRNVVKQFADVSFLVNTIVGAVFFTLLFLTGNTMLQSVRERVPELGVLKTFGYADTTILWLVLCESALLCIAAALVGLGVAALVFPVAGRLLGNAHLAPRVVPLGILVALLLALASGLPPAWRALRLRVVDAIAAR